MPKYKYKVYKETGEVLEGIIETESIDSVYKRFSDGFYISEISELRERKALFDFFTIIKRQEIYNFSLNLSNILKSGIPIISGIDVLISETNNIKMKKILRKIRSDLEKGNQLSYSLGKFPRYFDQLFITVVKVGETSGNLAEVLKKLSEHIKSEMELKRKLKTTLLYPSIILTMIILVSIFLIIFVFPKFSAFYKSVGAELPKITKFFISLPEILKFHLTFLIFLFIIFFVFYLFKKTEIGRKIMDVIRIKIPIFGPLYKKINITLFCESLSILVKSGVGILPSLKISAETLPSYIYKNEINKAIKKIREGENLSYNLRKSKYFPAIVPEMIKVGEETGNIEESLDNIQEIYNNEIDNTLKNLTTILEPILLVIVAGFVLVVALALYLPIFNLIKVIK